MRNLQNMQLWVSALRSGEFPQGIGYLNRNGEFCCLGVACEIAMRNGVELDKKKSKNTNDGVIEYDGAYETLPQRVADWLGVSQNPVIVNLHGDPVEAAHANDSLQWDFEQIANALVEYYGLSEDED